jgi:hypothetical protein
MAEKKEKGAAQEKVRLFIPKESKDDDGLFLSVNGKRILVKKGVPVFVEPKYAEVYFNSLAAENKANAYIEENASV